MNSRYLTGEQANLLLGFILSLLTPYITALFTQRRMSDGAKLSIAAGVSVVMACAYLYITGQWTFGDLATASVSIFVTSQTMFRNVALKMGLRTIENMTTPPDQRVKDEPLPTSSTVEAAQAIDEVKEQGEVQ